MPFREQILYNTDGGVGIPLPVFGEDCAGKLLERIARMNLYAHSYSFISNFTYGDFGPQELLDFAHKENLNGIMINIEEKYRHSLSDATAKELVHVRSLAAERRLEIILDVSSTTKSDIDSAVRIATALGVRNIRVYSGLGGHISDVMERTIDDLRYVSRVAEKNDLFFVLEQHEALTSDELVSIIKSVNSSRINLLFDSGNMVNANEEPLVALQKMSPFIRHAHLKDVRKVVLDRGCGQLGVRSGEGDLPEMKIIFDLLMLGDSEPSVRSFGLQEVVGYRSSPYRFDGEDEDPVIPHREKSETILDKNYTLENNLARERKNASDQVRHIRDLLARLQDFAEQAVVNTTRS